MLLPLPPAGCWAFDEFLRRRVLFFLSEGKPISIEIPTGNNPPRLTRPVTPALPWWHLRT